MTPQQREQFIRANTKPLPVPLVPDISLFLAHESVPLWQKTEEELGQAGLPPPFWAFAWAGGQALARYILDVPVNIKGRRIIDLASGSGLVAIAAMKAGAKSVVATDVDSFATTAIGLNSKLNGVDVTAIVEDLLLAPAPSDCDVILVGDFFYEKHAAAQLIDWLFVAHARGLDCLIGDPGRSYLPKDRLVLLKEYNVPVTRDLEDAEIKKTAVWRLA